MDYFNDVFLTCLGLESVSFITVYRGGETTSDFIKNILICVPKMNKDIQVLNDMRVRK